MFGTSDGPVRTILAAAVATLTVAACGSSMAPASTTSSGSSAANTPASSSAGTSDGTSTPAAVPAACSLLTADQVTALLGGQPAQSAGKEDDFSPTYKSCDWLGNPPAGGTSTALDIRVFVRASATAPGFGLIADDGTPSPVTGIGDSASFAAKDGTGANLIVNSGLTAVSISSQGPASGAALKSTMVSDMPQVLTELGA